MSFLHSQSHEPKSGAGKFAVLVLIVLAALGGVAYWFLSHAPEPTPAVEEASPPPATEPAPEPEPLAIPEEIDVATTGNLSVRANVEGAAVFVNGESVGEAPYERSDLPPGRVEIRVEKDGYQPFVESVRVRAGQTATLNASLRLVPASLHISSDVPGATVFVDRDYKGTTPIDITDIATGEHQITVSAEGFDMHSDTVTIGAGRNEVRVSFKDVQLNESLQVVHKHTFGNCEGTLIADNDGIRYETSDKDAFRIPYSQLERFEVDYIEKNMNLKIRGGKNYNFTEKSGNADALFLFHKNVQDFLGRS